jgi:hypothetical protein
MRKQQVCQAGKDEGMQSGAIRDEIKWNEWVTTPNHFDGILVVNAYGRFMNRPYQRTARGPGGS